ncbi:hemolysin family protein [Trueperella bernardiae]|uniref:Magnesium and cobalt efflux protein CorC n=1 Tax=Trueperella bernardiae TaxID=59561 RepID=A0A0W1KJY3_9ACTO|nr:hemolysin family protein [Trueperella bernardiae]KTF03935.1 Magnesium and cobalt efflux protein CorC [Trueperella bernardiae]MCM3907757.1 hemolysin family protein [Trueperella bernardiae]
MIESEVSLTLASVVAIVALLGTILTNITLQALHTITHPRVRQAIEEGNAGEHLARIYERRPATLAAVTAVHNVFLMLLGLGVFTLITDFVHAAWLVWIVTLVVAVLALMGTGLLLPAHLGAKYPVQALRVGDAVLWPLARLGSVFVTRRETAEEERETRYEDELQVMVERVSESEVLEDDERSMLHSVFELSHTIVREVMVPRTDMISIDATEDLDHAISLFTRSGFSRVPVIGESSDDLLGVAYLKDVVRRIHRRTDTEGLLVSDVMREAQFVPEFMLADDLLAHMQATQNHIAFAVDEWGGIAGLVTIEDLLEELVGEMVDEHDRALPEVEQIDDGVFRVPARMPIDEVAELFGIDVDDDDVESIGGLLAKGLGKIPISGSEATIAGLVLAADRFEGRRKRLVSVIVKRAQDEDE